MDRRLSPFARRVEGGQQIGVNFRRQFLLMPDYTKWVDIQRCGFCSNQSSATQTVPLRCIGFVGRRV